MKKFYLNEEEITEEEFNKQLEGCIAEYVDNAYDDLIDEDHEEYQIGYLTFPASEVLKNCDPIAYNCGFSDYESEIFEEAENELENRGYYEIVGDTFKIEEEEEEE